MYREVLVPLDGSELAECALEHVRAIAKGCQVDKVVLLRVLDPPFQAGAAKSYIAAEHVRQAEDKLEADARGYLDRVASDLSKNGVSVKTELVLSGEPAAKILESAREDKVDLIIMSTHGRSGVSSWVFGSVAERIVRHSPIPVLIVAPCGFRRS